jgi:hypothetical protein
MIHIASIIVKRVQKTLPSCEASATLRAVTAQPKAVFSATAISQ